MTERERLKEIIVKFKNAPEETCAMMEEPTCNGCKYLMMDGECDIIGRHADFLLANGVTLPPVTVGQKVYQTDGVRICELTVRKVIYETETVAFDEEAIGNSIFLSAKQAGKKLSAAQAKKKLTYEEFKADLGPAIMEISEHDRLAMYAAYLNDDAEDRE